MTTEEMYEKFGIKKDLIDFGKNVLKEIEDRFAKIDEVAEINQLKVIHAMQKNRVSENHLWGTTGYGYNDTGRDTLEAVYADIFEAEDALVLAVMLFVHQRRGKFQPDVIVLALGDLHRERCARGETPVKSRNYMRCVALLARCGACGTGAAPCQVGLEIALGKGYACRHAVDGDSYLRSV